MAVRLASLQATGYNHVEGNYTVTKEGETYMCYDDNARPPLPPDANGAAKGEELVLQAPDGNRFAAYIAQPEHPTGARVLIFPDVRGLHQFYKELALRFAETGITALAIDYFGRTAGLTSRSDGAFEFWPHVQQINVQNLFSDITAGLAYLRQDGNNAPIFTVGFCLGGSLSFLTATQNFGQAGAIGFYASLSRIMPGGTDSVLDEAVHITCPVLGLFGGADPGIPSSDVQALDTNLDKAGVEHEIIIYPNAPHSFFDKRATDYADASTDSWQRVQAFIKAHNVR
jgi:carboxymethylenebutenolidase